MITKKSLSKLFISFTFLLTSFALVSCEQKPEAVGTEKNPIKMAFMPSENAAKLNASVEQFKTFLQKDTGYVINAYVAPDYISIIEDFGKKSVDVAAINTLGYMLAHDWNGAEAHLQVIRGTGLTTYTGQIIVRSDSDIKDVSQLNNKSFAFTDPYSTTGYILAINFFHDKQVKLGQTIFTRDHSKVFESVYKKESVAGATYFDPPDKKGNPTDARKELVAKYPDINKKIKTLAFTGIVPNNPFAFRKDLPEDAKTKIIGALIKFSGTPEGKKALLDSYDITGFGSTKDSDYDGIRDTLKKIGKAPEDLVPGGLRIYAQKLNTELTPP